MHLLILFMVTSAVHADPLCLPFAHTVHTVTANKSAHCVLSKLFEPDHFCLVDGSGNDLSGQSLAIGLNTPLNFEMRIDLLADFNMEYALTCTADDGQTPNRPKVIFVVGAQGPANPLISVVPLNGGQGVWSATGAGENFELKY